MLKNDSIVVDRPNAEVQTINLAHETLQFSAEKFYDAIAVKIGNSSLTYGELDNISNQVSNLLIQFGITKGDCIGIYIEKSLETIICMFGILKVGAVYVPMDPNNPVQRNIHIVKESGISTIFTMSSNVDRVRNIFQACSQHFKIILMDTDDSTIDRLPNEDTIIEFHEIAQQSEQRKKHDNLTTQDTAVIFYTSGSTGDPKGVMVSHESIVTFIKWALNDLQISRDDKLISHAPLHFDISLLDIFATFAAAAFVALIPASKVGNPGFIIKLLLREKITIWQSVPSILILMVECVNLKEFSFDHVQKVIFTGERMPVKNLKILSRHFNKARFFNIYGCTETNDTFMYSIPNDISKVSEPLPIGSALPYVSYRIADKNNRDVGIGEEGELHVCTPTVMQGYQKDPYINGTMVNHQSSNGTMEKYYRTRDLVVQLEDGNLELCGRTDDIIKTNGNRVNLLEVQSCLQSHSNIIESAVFTINDDIIGKRIVAIVSKNNDIILKSIEIRIFCSIRLPKYAIPSIIEIRNDRLPTTSSGKINKKALKEDYLHCQQIVMS